MLQTKQDKEEQEKIEKATQAGAMELFSAINDHISKNSPSKEVIRRALLASAYLHFGDGDLTQV